MFLYTLEPVLPLTWVDKFPNLSIVLMMSGFIQAILIFGLLTAYKEAKKTFVLLYALLLAFLGLFAWVDFHYDTVPSPSNEKVLATFMETKHVLVREEKMSGKSKVFFSSNYAYATFRVGSEYVDVAVCPHQSFTEQTVLYKNKIASRTTEAGKLIAPPMTCH